MKRKCTDTRSVQQANRYQDIHRRLNIIEDEEGEMFYFISNNCKGEAAATQEKVKEREDSSRTELAG